jgi:uncharacterized protein YkwD
MRVRGSAAVVLAALLGLAALLAPSASAESSPSAYGDRLVALINQARQQHGLRALTVTSGTSTVAANWTQHLDSQQALSHNPDLGPQLESHGSPDWTAYGENVGDGPTSSADTLFQAYMNSPEHRDNILNSSYRYLGVGVIFDGSTAWNTLDFVDQYSTSKPRTTTTQSTPTSTKTTTRTTTQKPTQSAPKVATKTAPRPAPRPAARVQHAAPRPAARPHAAAKPSVQAVASTVAAAPAAAPVAAAPAALRLSAPVHGPTRDTAPFAAAAAMILLVVASRYAAEVLPRRA